ncbi:MAG: tetratricopeptide repeat protein [Gammaproteobacteria bacterium]|nr:MAG: tetratricopeptide repeat protein [Gammaproteobacteria bacterium]
MPILGILIIVLQVIFIVHAIRHGHGIMWVFIILLFPLIGILVYLFVIFIPEMRNSHVTTRAASKIKKTLDPKGALRQHTQNLEVTDTVENKLRLAEELLSQGMQDDAVHMYEQCRSGIFKDDPSVLLGLARAYFATEQYQKVVDTLDHLIASNPNYKSQDGHLLYARAKESLGDTATAIEEYEALCAYYSGAEAKCRYAQLLKQQGDHERAEKFFREIINTAERSSRHHRKQQEKWIAIARREIG